MAAGDALRPLRVALGEDDVLLGEGIARILVAARMEVVVRSGDADALLRGASACRPDVGVADVQMPLGRRVRDDTEHRRVHAVPVYVRAGHHRP
jgi:DNA-binding NarL/FixJ family response regulator